MKYYENLEGAPCKIGDIATRFKGGRHGSVKEGDSREVIGFQTDNHRTFRVMLKDDNEYQHDPTNLSFQSIEPVINNSYPLY